LFEWQIEARKFKQQLKSINEPLDYSSLVDIDELAI
jgi:hypothetical protein